MARVDGETQPNTSKEASGLRGARLPPSELWTRANPPAACRRRSVSLSRASLGEREVGGRGRAKPRVSSPCSHGHGSRRPRELRGWDRSGKKGLGKAGFAGELEERIFASLQVQAQRRTGRLRNACTNPKHPPFFPHRAWHKTPHPSLPKPLPRIPVRHLPQQTPLRPVRGPAPNAPRPSGRESRSPAWLWLRVEARRESRLLTPRARCGGSRKQLNFTTAPIRHPELEERGLSRRFKNSR